VQREAQAKASNCPNPAKPPTPKDGDKERREG